MAAARGCGSCRAARVKCDGLRPVCARCNRLGLTCEGYRDAGALIIRDQTKTIAPKFVRSGRESKGASELADIPQPKSLHILPRYIDTSGYLPWLEQPIAPQLHPKWEDVAIARFLSNYVLEASPQDVHTGYLADLPAFYAQTSPQSVLHYAVVACSFLSFGLQANNPKSRRVAQQIYGAALGKLRAVTLDVELASKDETVLAMLVLDYYSMLDDNDPGAVGPHTSGLSPILRLRGAQQLTSATGWNIFRAAHRRMQYRILLMDETPLNETAEWMAMLNHEHAENTNASSIYRATKARLHAKTTLQNAQQQNPGFETFNEVVAAVAEMEAAERNLRSFNETAGSTWRLGLTRMPTTSSARSRAYTSYHDIYVATTWNYNRVGRWLLSETLHDCWSYLAGQNPDQSFVADAAQHMERCRQAVVDEVEENLNSVPFFLGQIDCNGVPTVSKHTRELSKFYAYIGVRPINESRLCTDDQKERARAMETEIISRMKRWDYG